MAYTAPFAVSAMIDSKNQDWLNKLWTHMAALPPSQMSILTIVSAY